MFSSLEPRTNVQSQTGKTTAEAVLFAAAIVAIALRFLARWKTKMHLWWDDWLALVAGSIFTAYCAMLFWATDAGLRVIDPTTMTMADVVLALKLTFVSTFLMSAIITAARFSVIFLYWRLFSVYPGFRIALYTMSILSVGWFIMIEFLSAFRCKPVSAAWDPLNQQACLDLNMLFIPTESIHCVLDFVLVLLPLWRIREMHLSLRDRIAVSAVFLTGTFTSVTSILRMVFVHGQHQYQSAFWLALQLSFHIIAACLPTLRTFLPSREPSRTAVTSLFSSALRHEHASPTPESAKASSQGEYSGSEKSREDVGGGVKESNLEFHTSAV